MSGDFEAVGTENDLKDNEYEPAGAWAGKEIDVALCGDGSQGEYYGEMVGLGAKGTAKAVQTLNKAQWTRGTFQAANTKLR